MCGSNTSFDRECLLRGMPKVAAYCDAETFDVSILLMFFTWFRPELSTEKPKRSKLRHRSTGDIHDSLNLFRFYQKTIAL